MNADRARDVDREPHGSSDDNSLLDFSANTNPRVPDGAETVYRDAFEKARTYPQEPPAQFERVASNYVGCDPEHVVPMPGGLAAIRQTIALAVEAGDSVLVPAPSFGEYAREVRLQGGEPVFVPQESIVDADPSGHALAIVCRPNNPTGDAYERRSLERFVERCRVADTPLLVDEAFLGFTEAASLAGTDGVVVARSLTKLFGLPGIRIGFATATDEWAVALQSARRAWNVSQPAISVGAFCMQQDGFVSETRNRVHRERERMRTRLSESFDVRPSEAPFLLVDVGERDVDSIIEHTQRNGIAVRDARTFRRLDSHIRLAVREPGENDELLAVLDTFTEGTK